MAFALYVCGLPGRSVWYDEAITLQSLSSVRFSPPVPGFLEVSALKQFVTGVTTTAEVVRRYVETDVHPPLYFLLAHAATLVFGTHLWVVRAVSLVLVLASVALLGRTLQRIAAPGAWLLTGVYAFSFAAVTTAQDARGYALAVLLAVAAWRTLALADAEGRGRLAPDIVLGLLCGALMLTHYFALFVVVPVLVWRGIETAARRDYKFFVAPLIAAAVFAPWLPVMLDHLGARPGQMTGFEGLLPWIKQMLQLVPGQVVSATHWAIPGALQTLARGAVLLLIAAGVFDVLRRSDALPGQRRFGQCAVWIPGFGLLLFLAVSIIMDRWFDTLRYILFFAPFLAYLAGRGALSAGRALATAIPSATGRVAIGPALVLIFVEIAMANFGWEANRNRGGGYFNSIAAQVRDVGAEDTLVVVDTAYGRGTLLAAIHALPPETKIYLLDPDTETWGDAGQAIGDSLDSKRQVILIFTIQRGAFGSDKAQLYTPLVETLESKGFARGTATPDPVGGRHYAKWERADGDD